MATLEDVEKWEQTYGPSASDTAAVVSNGKIVGEMPYGEETGKYLNTGVRMFQQGDGSFSADPYSSVTFNKDTGKITIEVPDVFQDDERVNKIVDDAVLQALSSNYKVNKDVEYQDPYDENKKIKTEDYVKYINDALQSRITTLGVLPQEQYWLKGLMGGNKKAEDVVNSLSADDVITMNTGSGDGTTSSTPVGIPKYIQDIFPKIAELASFNNGYVKNEELQNWYNISENLTKEQALALEKYYMQTALSPDKVKDMTTDELAKTVSFGRWLSKNDPKMSGWDKFWTDTGNLITGFNEAIYSNVATLLDSMINLSTAPIRMGYRIPAAPIKEALWPGDKAAVPDYWEQLEESRYVNPGGAVALGAGYAGGTIAWTAADIVLTNISMSVIGEEIVANTIKKGTEKLAEGIADETFAAFMKDPAAASYPSTIVTGTEGFSASDTAFKKALGDIYARAQRSWRMSANDLKTADAILNNASAISQRIWDVTQEQLSMLNTTQVSKIISSAFEIVRDTKKIGTAMSVMSSFVLAATLDNADLTNQIIRGDATSNEIKTWIRQMAFDTAKMELIGSVGKIGAGAIGGAIKGTKAEKVLKTAKGEISRGAKSFKDFVTGPWVKYREWALRNKMMREVEKNAIKNHTLAAQQALRQEQLVRKFRGWEKTQTTYTPPEFAWQKIPIRNAQGEVEWVPAGTVFKDYYDIEGMPLAEEVIPTAKEIGKMNPVDQSIAKETSIGISSALGMSVYDPVTEVTSEVSPYMATQAGEARLRNVLTDLGDIQTLETQLISQFSDPKINPVISDRLNEAADADTDLIKMEIDDGLLDNKTIKSDRKILKAAKKEPFDAMLAGHSRDVVVFAVRSQELKVAENEARRLGLPLKPETPKYGEALARYNKAAEKLTPRIINQINNVVLPAYRALEHEITNYAIDPLHAVLPRDLIIGLRLGGKWGEGGRDWIRLAAAKEMPNGTYVPRDRFTKNDTLADMHRDKVLEDDQITWIGNGLNAMIREIATAEGYKRMVITAKQTDNLIVGTVKSGEETAAASAVKEYEKDFHESVKKSIKGFSEDMAKSQVVSRLKGKPPVVRNVDIKGELSAGDETKLLERGPIVLGASLEHTRASGIMGMDGIDIRNVMADNKLATSDMIVDQNTLNQYYLQSTDAAKKVLADNFSNYAIADYRAFLNTMLPGFDVLEWGLLDRTHTNGIFPGGMYYGMNDPVKVYAMGIDDLRKLIGQTNLESMEADSVENIRRHINTRGKDGVLPLHYRDGEFGLELRWYDKYGSDIRLTDWEDYLNYLASKGVTRVPVAVTATLPDIHRSDIDNAVLRFTDAIDKAHATAEKPDFDIHDVARLYVAPTWGEIKLRDKLGELPKELMSSKDISDLIKRAKEYAETNFTADKHFGFTDDELTEKLDNLVRSNIDESHELVDITDQITQAQADYGMIPWFHSQEAPLGTAEFNVSSQVPSGNAVYSANDGVGDALWVSPNSSYTDKYGDQKTIANIPREYFMTDKEIKAIVKDLSSELNALRKKAIAKGGKEWRKAADAIEAKAPTKILEGVGGVATTMPDIAKGLGLRPVSPDIYVNEDGLMYRASYKVEKKANSSKKTSSGTHSIRFSFTPEGKVWISPKLENEFLEKGKKLLSKKDKTRYDKLYETVGPRGGITSYRAIAEYAGKPVIDTTMDMNRQGINGTAFFYYKGVSPEFDKNIGGQLETQAKATPDTSAARRASDMEYIAETMKFHDLLWDAAGDSEEAQKLVKDILSQSKKYTKIPANREAERSDIRVKIHNDLEALTNRTFGTPREGVGGLIRAIESDYIYIDGGDLVDIILGDKPYQEYIIINDITDKEYESLVDFYDLGDYITPEEKSAWENIDPTNSANVPTGIVTKRDMVDFDKFTKLRGQNYTNVQQILDEADKLNAYSKLPKRQKKILEEGKKINRSMQDFWKENIYDLDFTYEVKPETPKAKSNPADNLKYKLDEDRMIEDVDNAIDNMISLVADDLRPSLYMEGANTLGGFEDSDARKELYILSDLLSKDNKKALDAKIKKISKKIVDSAIPPKKAVIKGNLDSLYRKTEQLMKDRFISRLADAKRTLEATGESVETDTIKELLKKFNEDVAGYATKDIYIQTTDVNGNLEWLEVDPVVGELYNKRPLFKPMGTIQATLTNAALAKRIGLTNVNPASFMKQLVSDPVLGFVTTGSMPIPGVYSSLVKLIAAQYGEDIAMQMAKYDPRRYVNVKESAERLGVSEGEAAVMNISATLETQLPFATLNQEALRQADVNRYGGGKTPDRRAVESMINSGLRKTSDFFGKPNDIREQWNRQINAATQLKNMLDEGYNYAQAEEFARHAQDNATTNFRQKHTVLNALRSTVPYLTASISGMKSFWQMFELDPIGVTTRILTGFVVPIIWLMGEIMDNDDLREQYKNLSESEKQNHIIVAINGQLVRIPVGEELGSITNLVTHMVENAYGANQYDFWLLMLNDTVGFLPTDFTGFTDPEMWQNIIGQPPSFLDVMENGVSKFLAATMPPVVQSAVMISTGRDLYNGKKVNTTSYTVDDEGHLVIDSWSQSEFSKAAANIIGGDARVIERVISGLFGTTPLHVLDTITSAVQWIGSGGQEGSLTTAMDKLYQDISKHYTVQGYNSLDRQWNRAIDELYNKKEQIEVSQQYRTLNDKISQEKNQQKRKNLINERNGLLTDFQNQIESLVNSLKSKGGALDSLKFSKIASLLTFEDAVRADRAYAHLNTEYGNARKVALESLYRMGIKDPEGPSSLGYLYYDDNGEVQVKVWTPAQMQIIQDSYYQQGDIHQANIKAILDAEVKEAKKSEEAAEQKYWDKYNATGKLSNAEWDELDNLKKAYNAQVVLAIRDYIDSYGPEYILNNETVLDYLENMIKVPSEYEKVNGRYVSSSGGKLNKQQGFARSYIKAIFGVQ